jgi:hypothetical protein
VAAKQEKQALQDPEPTPAEEASGQRDEAADLELLEKFSQLRRDGHFEKVKKMFAEDAKWVTLYKKPLEGSEGICAWLTSENDKGRVNTVESPWRVDGEKYSRDLTTKFPRGGLHEVIQSAVISRGLIQEMAITPKWAAHALVIDFALAREQGDDQTALQKMDKNVVWKTWDNAEVTGKSAVAELLAERRKEGEKREGMSDFEALGEVTEEHGIFERSMDIQRADGVRVNGMQTLTVSLKGGRFKITEVYVHPEKELQDGQWVEPVERERSSPAIKPTGHTDDGKKPKCGCAVM